MRVDETYDDSGRGRSPPGAVYVPHLVVLLECDRPRSGGARYSLEGVGRVLVGRGERRTTTRVTSGGVTTLEVRIPGRSLSAQHARLTRMGDAWALEDLGSRNGTWIEGGRVERAVLEPTDVFEVGHTYLRVNPSVAMTCNAPFDVDSADAPGGDIGTLDPSFGLQLEALATIAPSDVPVLLLGESGTGKEVLARWVHERARRKGNFVAVNCGAIPAALVESTLFGHVKGAFSGALRDEAGLVRAADGGTLFLDEIADLPKASQAALLRVLQEREVLAVGASQPATVDFRLVAATHQPLDEMVARGDFRRDLYARVAGFTARLPRLQDRIDDLGVIVASLLEKIASPDIVLEPEVGRALIAYDWPLNIRELGQCLAACVALAKGGSVEAQHLPQQIARALEDRPAEADLAATAGTSRDERLRLELLAKIAEHRGNLADVARAMGKARMQIHRWCRRFGIEPNAFRS